jgi:hypothetical protein
MLASHIVSLCFPYYPNTGISAIFNIYYFFVFAFLLSCIVENVSDSAFISLKVCYVNYQELLCCIMFVHESYRVTFLVSRKADMWNILELLLNIS